VRIGERRSAKSFGPYSDWIGIFLKFPVDVLGSVFGPAPNNGSGKIFLRREMIVDAGALDADIRRDFPEAETTEAPPLGSAARRRP